MTGSFHLMVGSCGFPLSIAPGRGQATATRSSSVVALVESLLFVMLVGGKHCGLNAFIIDVGCGERSVLAQF